MFEATGVVSIPSVLIGLKKSFTDNIRIEQLLCILKGGAKHSILSKEAYFEIVEKGTQLLLLI